MEMILLIVIGLLGVIAILLTVVAMRLSDITQQIASVTVVDQRLLEIQLTNAAIATRLADVQLALDRLETGSTGKVIPFRGK
jgi:type II secretory pathway component PulJ